MGLHGLAEQTVEVEPYRTYELGPFEVSFTPSVHSKLLLGLAVPYDGDLTCEHLDGLSPGAYRCGQVWGISIRVAGMRLYHQGSANLIDDAVRERDVDVFLAGVAGRSFTDDYWKRILPRLDPGGRPHPLRQLLPPARPARWSSSPTSSSPSSPRRSAPSAATSSSPPSRADSDACSRMQRLCYASSAWRRSARSCPWSVASSVAERGLDRPQVEVRIRQCRRSAASRARAPRSPDRSSSVARASAFLRACRRRLLRAAARPGACPSRPRAAWPSNGSCAAIAASSARCAGRPAPRSRAPRPGPLRSAP